MHQLYDVSKGKGKMVKRKPGLAFVKIELKFLKDTSKQQGTFTLVKT